MVTGMIIAALCAGQLGNYSTACTKAAEAGSKYGVEQTLEGAETKVTKTAEKFAKDKIVPLTGETIWGAAFVGAKIAQTHEVVYTLHPGKKVLSIDTIDTKVGITPDKASGITIGWNF